MPLAILRLLGQPGAAAVGQVRFAFCKKLETLEAAGERLRELV